MATHAARLARAQDVYAPRRRRRAASAPIAEWAFLRYPPVFDGRETPDFSKRGELDRRTRTAAEVNFGRWIARCPFCPSAQVVTPDDQRFLCAGADGCGNAAVRGAFVGVRFPPPGQLVAIEAVLMRRPRANRNWSPGQTVADLRKENAAHGLDGA